MLVLTRKVSEEIRIGDDVVIKVIKTGKGAVKIGIDAPDQIRVIRGELLKDVVEPAVSVLPDPVNAGVLSDQYPHVA